MNYAEQDVAPTKRRWDYILPMRFFGYSESSNLMSSFKTHVKPFLTSVCHKTKYAEQDITVFF